MADYITDALKGYTANMPKYQAGIDPLMSYYTDIMSGGPAMLQKMAPEVNAASRQFQQAIANTREGAYARSGSLARTTGMLEGQRAGTISNLLAQARPWAAGQLSTLLHNQQLLSLEALNTAQRQQQAQQEASWRKWTGIGSGIIDILKTPIGKGGSLLGTLLGKIPGMGGGAAAGAGVAGAIGAGGAAATGFGLPAGFGAAGSFAGLIPSVESTIPAVGLAGAGGGAAAAVPGAVTPGAAGGIMPFLTNPWTIGVGAGLAGAYAWKKSQAHPQANEWVQGDQNRFDSTMASVDQQLGTGQLNEATADALRKTYMDDYIARLKEFATKGSHQKEVANNALNTFRQWYSTHANRLGVNLPGGF